jgi:hypothetical protein
LFRLGGFQMHCNQHLGWDFNHSLVREIPWTFLQSFDKFGSQILGWLGSWKNGQAKHWNVGNDIERLILDSQRNFQFQIYERIHTHTNTHTQLIWSPSAFQPHKNTLINSIIVIVIIILVKKTHRPTMRKTHRGKKNLSDPHAEHLDLEQEEKQGCETYPEWPISFKKVWFFERWDATWPKGKFIVTWCLDYLFFCLLPTRQWGQHARNRWLCLLPNGNTQSDRFFYSDFFFNFDKMLWIIKK